jgi:hypothetical protein
LDWTLPLKKSFYDDVDETRLDEKGDECALSSLAPLMCDGLTASEDKPDSGVIGECGGRVEDVIQGSASTKRLEESINEFVEPIDDTLVPVLDLVLVPVL